MLTEVAMIKDIGYRSHINWLKGMNTSLDE